MASAGCLSWAYGIFLGVATAVAPFGLIAMETGSGSLRRIYTGLLIWCVVLDVCWMGMWTLKIAENYSDVKVNGQIEWEMPAYRNSIKLALAMEFLTFFLRLASVPAWMKAAQDMGDYGAMEGGAPPTTAAPAGAGYGGGYST